MVQYCYCLYFLNSKALVLFQYPFKNYRLINRYRPVWSNLAIGIGKIHYQSTSNFYFKFNEYSKFKYFLTALNGQSSVGQSICCSNLCEVKKAVQFYKAFIIMDCFFFLLI